MVVFAHYMGMKSSSFSLSVLVMSISGVLCKVIGVFFRIPLINMLGAEGIGIYQLVFPIYTLLITLSSSGVGIAVCKLLCRADDRDRGSILLTALLYSLVLSTIVALSLVLLAPYIGALQGNSDTTLGYIAIAPSILFMGIISPMRAYFQSKLDMTPTAISQLIEQVVKLVFGLYFAYILLPRGIVYGVVGALLGVSLSELVATIYLVVLYLVRGEGLPYHIYNSRYHYTQMLLNVLPVTIGSLISPLVAFIDSMLAVNIISGMSDISVATSQYGICSASVGTIINMPIVLAISISSAIFPHISRGEGIESKTNLALRFCFAIGIGATLLLISGGGYIVRLLYPTLSEADKILATRLMTISALQVLFLSGTHIYTALLQGYGLMNLPVYNLCITAVVKLVLTIVLLNVCGIYGCAISSTISAGVTFAMSWGEARQFSRNNGYLLKNISKITLAGGIMFGIIYSVWYFAPRYSMLAIIVGGCVYIGLLMLTRVFALREIVPLRR